MSVESCDNFYGYFLLLWLLNNKYTFSNQYLHSTLLMLNSLHALST